MSAKTGGGERRVLVFTDSRGQHKRSFADRPIFTERLKEHLGTHGRAVDLVLCPFKWTTTLDFLDLIERGIIEIERYERVILYTGVVEWSPRNLSNYEECVRGNGEPIDPALVFDNRRPKRIANDKRPFLRQFFGEATYDAYAATSFDVTYRGERTRNLISVEMLERQLIPHLKKTVGEERLIVINANRILPGWDGDYLAVNPDGRPANISMIADYSEIVRENFSNVVDLLAWSDEETKRFTVDNMHLTHEGSEWMLEQLLHRL